MILFHLENKVGFICLNRPSALNALNEQMYLEMKSQILSWIDSNSIHALCIYSCSDRFFSAGGDVKDLILRSTGNEQKLASGKSFFTLEYEFDLFLHNISIPKIAIASGILMGGGLGLFEACNIKIVHQNIVVAMPEVTIGLFPDVGASYFLRKNPEDGLGPFVGLTGSRFGASELKRLNLCHSVVACDTNLICNELKSMDWSAYKNNEPQSINEIQERINNKFGISKERVSGLSVVTDEDDGVIQELYKAQLLIEFESQLTSILETSTSEFLSEAAKIYFEGSPLSRNIIFFQLFMNPKSDLKNSLIQEWCLAMNCLEKGDFLEGVRALLIDKDKTPKWLYSSVEEVSLSLVESFQNRADCPDFEGSPLNLNF